MDLDAITALLNLLNEHDVSSFSYEDETKRIKLTLGPPGATQQVMAAPMPAPIAMAAPASAPSIAAAAPAAVDDGLVIIDSPMVGTFYSAASPDSDPYVSVGARVQSGDVLCIVEAMKLMNEIEADVAGEIVEILVDNAQPVQFGQPLFKIRPA